MDLKQAEKNIKRTWLLSALAILVFYGYISLGKGVTGNLNFHLFLPWLFPGAVELPVLFLVLILTFTVYRRSRIGAMLLFVFYILNRYFTFMWLYIFSSVFIIIWLCVTVVWGFIFFQGIRGTFAYHRLKGAMTSRPTTMAETISPRKWWLAGFLSLVTPGLGQLYNGQLYKALVLFAVPMLFLPLGIYILLYHLSLPILIVGLSLIILYPLAVVIDAIIIARRIGTNYTARGFNRWYIYIVLLAVSLGVNSLIAYIESSYVQAFELASPNMQPTLLVGDHVLVNRRSSPGDLRRGDLIIHGYGKDSNRDYVERVVAIGGDNVEIRDEVLFVNDIPQNEPFVLHSDKGIIPKQDGPRDSFGPIIVPPHSYFVLGDNRDYGSDSLSWNVVDKRLVKGKIRTIYFSWDEENGAVRWERIGLQFQRRNDKPKS